MNITKKIVIAGAGAVVLLAGGGVAYASVNAPVAPKVTVEQAIDLAKKQVPGAWVSGVDHDDDGTWDVDLVKGDVEHELKLDANTGKVLTNAPEKADAETETDDDD
ncbi:PepSY domain-containing protein [Nonomuraea sp. NPDC050790]|uniref:PepSY domain-containing protein n=1 Tax=Nonomuraea sp. NPDC050790 TaxID=3364371 RepID=UPI0037A006D4